LPQRLWRECDRAALARLVIWPVALGTYAKEDLSIRAGHGSAFVIGKYVLAAGSGRGIKEL